MTGSHFAIAYSTGTDAPQGHVLFNLASGCLVVSGKVLVTMAQVVDADN